MSVWDYAKNKKKFQQITSVGHSNPNSPFSVHGLTAHIHFRGPFMLKSICCIQFGNGVHNGTISITYWGFLNDC